LSFYKNISDVSSLGSSVSKIHTLNLTRCTGLTDISSLSSEIYTLNLSYYPNISDIFIKKF